MYYIFTADRLTRTSVWLESLEGGVEHVKDVVIHDKLGLCDELDRRMQHLVDTYRCEWKEIVSDPAKRQLFRQFVNTDETEPCIEIVQERGQSRPADWPKDGALVQLTQPEPKTSGWLGLSASEAPAGEPGATEQTSGVGRKIDSRPLNRRLHQRWVSVGRVQDFPKDGGAAVRVGKVQIAIFNFTSRGQWYACQNMCPHKNAFVLSRGIIGTAGQEPKVACPLHKRPFSLTTGQCLSGEDFSVKVFPVRIVGDEVHVELPPQEQLDALLATELHCIGTCEPSALAGANH
jgi:nitrite reductase (NADH) large subunit